MRLALAALALLLALPAAAQRGAPVTAVTEDGRQILVYPDGTWEEAEVIEEIVLDLADTPPPPAPPPPPPPPPAAPGGERTLVSASGDYSITYDADRWRSSGRALNAESEFEFQLPFGAGFGVVIYEIFPADIETMRAVVLNNAQSVASAPVKVTAEKPVDLGVGEARRLEYEVVSMEGIRVTFITTIAATDTGVLQFLTWTPSSLLGEYRADLVRLQDGLALHADG